MATLPSLPEQGSTNWYTHYAALHSQGDAQEATLGDHESRITALEAAPPGSIPGVVHLSSFAGSTWDQRLTNALTYASQQTNVPWIQFPPGKITLNQGGRTPFNGLKMCGAGGDHVKNPEIGWPNSKSPLSTIQFGSGVGTGSNSWFHHSSTIQSVTIANLAFENNRSSQFWSSTGGNGLYAAEFRNLAFMGMKHIFGTPSQKALLTQVIFSGHWTVVSHNASDMQFHLGGSDNMLWYGGYCNLNGTGTANGEFQMRFDALNKTRVGEVYITCEQGWRGIRVSSSGTHDLRFYGLIAEGRNANTPCHGTVLSIEGGNGVALHGVWTGYAMSAPSTLGGGNNGVIQVSGGAKVLVSGATYERASGVNESVPWLYATGSGTKVTVLGVQGHGTWTGKPRYSAVSGASVVDLDSSLQAA